MSGVKRYIPEGYTQPASRSGMGTHMVESRDGDYVLASDYDALSQRCQELEHAATNDLLTRLLEQLDASNAENYHGAEFDVETGSEQMTAVVMLQRRGHPSAHDLRLQAEAQCNTLRAEVERLQSEMEDLMFALADAEHRAENAGRNASAFEDRMGDLQVENGKLRAQVEQLQATVDRLESAYLAWQEKTDWVQRGISDGSLSAKYLGWHRADILKAEIERLQTPGQRFTVIGKGGRYELLGESSGAGCCRGEGRVIYRCLDTGQLYHRKDDDFAARMAPRAGEDA